MLPQDKRFGFSIILRENIRRGCGRSGKSQRETEKGKERKERSKEKIERPKR